MTPRKVVNWLASSAESNHTNYQLEASNGGGTTDGMVIQMAREGILTGVVSVPCRYIHSPVELAHVLDIKDTARLLTGAVENCSLWDDNKW